MIDNLGVEGTVAPDDSGLAGVSYYDMLQAVKNLDRARIDMGRLQIELSDLRKDMDSTDRAYRGMKETIEQAIKMLDAELGHGYLTHAERSGFGKVLRRFLEDGIRANRYHDNGDEIPF